MPTYIDDEGRLHVDFRGRQMENRWTRYRAKKLFDLGFSEWEIMALKYNKMTNPRIAQLYRDIIKEVKRFQEEQGLPDYAAAAKYRRDNWISLIDSGEIEEYDPYIRMGYWEEYIPGEEPLWWLTKKQREAIARGEDIDIWED